MVSKIDETDEVSRMRVVGDYTYAYITWQAFLRITVKNILAF